MYILGRPFGETDPYFGADLGFFVYWLPFETAVHYWAIVVLVSITVLVILLYALTPSLRWERGTLHVSAYVRRHFTILGAVLLLILAWKNAGYVGLDYFLLPLLGTPWKQKALARKAAQIETPAPRATPLAA